MAFTAISSRCQWTWHLNSRNSKPALDYTKFSERVVSFQADGHELESIRIRLPNVPITLGGVCKWRGEMAQFIYDNL